MGFNPRLAPMTKSFVFAHDPTGDEIFSLFRFPVAGQVITAYATNSTPIAASGSSTNTLALYLAKYSSATTPVVQGTLGSWSAAATWAQDVPRAMTLTSFGSTALFSAGEWVRLSYDENDLGLWTEMCFQFDYLLSHENGVTPSPASGPS
jgi:hypothetical protein